MFSLIKNFGKKNISTKTMTTDEYVSAVSSKVFEAWNDEYVSERSNKKSVFEKGAKIQKNLSYEELCECSARISRLIEIGNAFRHEFYERFEEAKDEKDNDDFFTATTLVKIVEDVAKKVKIEYPEEARTAETLERAINIRLDVMREICTNCIMTVVAGVKVQGYQMNGFV